jgi:NTE family protein
LIKERMRGSPSIISILMRAGTVGSNLQRKNVRALADFLYEPPLEGIEMRDWRAFERAIAQGYAYTMLEIQKNGIPLSDSWSAGPALAISRVPAIP